MIRKVRDGSNYTYNKYKKQYVKDIHIDKLFKV
jgi:hypothetical protein